MSFDGRRRKEQNSQKRRAKKSQNAFFVRFF
jgi:hypothetical protein